MDDWEKTSSDGSSRLADPLAPLQRLRPDLLGFVFHLSWLYLLLYSDIRGGALGINPSAVTDIVYLASAASLVATMAFGVARTKTFMQLCETRSATVIAPAVTAIGTLLYCINIAAPSPVLVTLGGILTGAGSAVLAARWASVLGNAQPGAVIDNLPTLIAAISIVCLSIGYLPHELQLALLVVLPLCTGATLQFARRYQHARFAPHDGSRAKTDDDTKNARIEADASGDGAHGKRRTGTIAGLIAFVALIGFFAALLGELRTGGMSYGLMFYLISGIAVLAFAAVGIVRAHRGGFFVLFVAPTAVLAVVLLPFIQYASTSVGDAFYPVGNISFELILLFGTVLFAQATDRSPAQTFMIGRITLAVFDLAGSTVGSLLNQAGSGDVTIQTASVVLFASAELLLAALVVAYLTSKRSRMLLREVEPAEPAPAASADAHADAPEVAPADVSASNAADVPAAAPTSTSAREAAAPVNVPDPIVSIAERHGLSEREIDVFRLLAEGNSSPRIQEALCISAGTVNFHKRNIYQKLGVHSKQELIDLTHRESRS